MIPALDRPPRHIVKGTKWSPVYGQKEPNTDLSGGRDPRATGERSGSPPAQDQGEQG